jgi:glycyl-tRNA synthetase alpha chain
VELTYGLERIAMFLQGTASVYDLQWAPGVTYGQVHHQDEVERSRYSFEVADVDMHFAQFDQYEAEGRRAIAAGCAMAAYDCTLRCSHLFNVLDARGAISVTERQRFILRVREMAFAVAKAYLDLRRELGYPLLGEAGRQRADVERVALAAEAAKRAAKAAKQAAKAAKSAGKPPQPSDGSDAEVRRG